MNNHTSLPGRWYSLRAFFLLAYGITWTLWLPLILSRAGVISPGEDIKYLHLLGGIGPAVSAIIMGRWFADKLTPGGPPQTPRTQAPYILLGVLGPVVLFFLSVLICDLAGLGSTSLARFGESLEYPELGRVPYWLVIILCFGWGEERGWRGFALPRLQSRFSPVNASLILGFFWSLWHLPVFFYDPQYMQMAGDAGIIGWLFSMATGSVIMSWLYNISRGNVLVVALFHGVLDIVINTPGSESLPMVMGMLLTLSGVLILVITRGRLGLDSRSLPKKP